ncbi:hypothetical protein [Buchnera aphidicola]|uniref:hypothetical protein n=1 Tax=Buchnera aphidicola TaxID=9 RepID=UPI0031B670DA
MKIVEWLKYSKKFLKFSSSPLLDAHIILKHILKLTTIKFILLSEKKKLQILNLKI